MKIISRIFQCLIMLAVIGIVGCDGASQKKSDESKKVEEPRILLYGEAHNEEDMLEKELKLWQEYYDSGMRDLFVELSYADGRILNMWMKAENDELLERLRQGWQGSTADSDEVLQFYRTIKEHCPETIFHGTDVGHDYETTGAWYLDYLEENGQKETEEYRRTQENMEQGKHYYDNDHDWAYRENKMVENFIKEYEKTDDAKVMGIYGAAHVDTEAMDAMSRTVPSMANQLKETYGELLYTEDLMIQKKEMIDVGGKEYSALGYGSIDVSYLEREYQSVEFWYLENAYDDFKDNKSGESVWRQEDAPMTMAEKRVYVLDLVMADGTKERKYYRTDPNSFRKLGTAKEFVVE